jgi:hypothetical protein
VPLSAGERTAEALKVQLHCPEKPLNPLKTRQQESLTHKP